jgi:hypothetical protein
MPLSRMKEEKSRRGKIGIIEDKKNKCFFYLLRLLSTIINYPASTSANYSVLYYSLFQL